jgi:hypothetical protein
MDGKDPVQDPWCPRRDRADGAPPESITAVGEIGFFQLGSVTAGELGGERLRLVGLEVAARRILLEGDIQPHVFDPSARQRMPHEATTWITTSLVYPRRGAAITHRQDC